jgi:hypothetical protein
MKLEDMAPPLSLQMKRIIDAWSPVSSSSLETQDAGDRRAADFGEQTYARLREQAASNRVAGEANRAKVERVMAEHTGPERLTAKLIQKKLGSDFQLAIRTIQDHMKIINARSSAPR